MLDLHTLAETGSTNDDLLALARDGAGEGTWLRADRQTGGKGRQGREWESPPGNLYASTIVRLRPDDPPAPTLALVAAVALHEALSEFAGGIEIAIKWPNDLTAFGAKLSGILLERLDHVVVVGFGANLAEHPDATLRPATSLAALGAGAPDPAQVLEALAQSFARWLGRWRS
ncbi:MAG TPA: biotin--[acetyl-CoA-carboxylase] ligase, partial [Allosphingosinicella sp.]